MDISWCILLQSQCFSIFQAGMVAACSMLKTSCEILNDPKHMVPSLMETGARFFVSRFLQDYIAMGSLM